MITTIRQIVFEAGDNYGNCYCLIQLIMDTVSVGIIPKERQ